MNSVIINLAVQDYSLLYLSAIDQIDYAVYPYHILTSHMNYYVGKCSNNFAL